MPENVTILCPYHVKEEELTIPDAYLGIAYSQGKEVIFEGDLPASARRWLITARRRK